MSDVLKRKRGLLLLIVLATIMVVIILGNVIMNILLNQARLTAHQLNRTQGYYAAMAGINLAYENLRNGTWAIPAAGVCPASVTFNATDLAFFPPSIRSITVNLAGSNANCGTLATCAPPLGSSTCLSTTVDYRYITP